MVFIFLAMLVGLGSLFLLLLPRGRKTVFNLFLLSVYVITALWAGIMVEANIQSRALAQLPGRAAPLVAAISAYEKANRHPPAELKDLVPEYIANIPWTGLSVCPQYQYRVFTEKGDSPWELSIPSSQGFLNWDVFFYWPTKKYPREIYGGLVEPIGAWAYVHE
jgi:hypothetical protein